MNYSVIDCVKYYHPEFSDQQAENYLWEETCYPFGAESMLEQLYNQFVNHV